MLVGDTNRPMILIHAPNDSEEDITSFTVRGIGSRNLKLRSLCWMDTVNDTGENVGNGRSNLKLLHQDWIFALGFISAAA